MSYTDRHAKYFAYELTRRFAWPSVSQTRKRARSRAFAGLS